MKKNLKRINPISILLIISLAAWWIWSSFVQEESYGVCFQGFNYTDKHVAEYYVNGMGGAAIFLPSPMIMLMEVAGAFLAGRR
ncbi:hypothetical protein [Iodobacter ciconiae]|uniref:Uncharacterized protein n=1 Tax=Iodobacter ciconiae TaxID=2496266 RepID=A0A3S8ZPZ8_9NEIS|nr:hypothetical protein [Iodobacter ciconiae]AZN35560.1 hypothetical protein EJO50_03100 [Iodobacter ciconiae]